MKGCLDFLNTTTVVKVFPNSGEQGKVVQLPRGRGLFPRQRQQRPAADERRGVDPPPEMSAHKNDVPLANPALLEQIRKEPTCDLNIDDHLRAICYYGETTTIVMDDNNICELSFKPEPRLVMVDNTKQQTNDLFVKSI